MHKENKLGTRFLAFLLSGILTFSGVTPVLADEIVNTAEKVDIELEDDFESVDESEIEITDEEENSGISVEDAVQTDIEEDFSDEEDEELTIPEAGSNAYVINGVTVHQDDFSSSPNECWAYANQVYNKIWGQSFNYSFSDSTNSLRNLSDSQLTLTQEHLKEYVSNAALGSVLRICNAEYLHGSDGWGHSQIIVQKDNNGFTVFQGGLSAAPYRNERYYTWSEYCNTGWLGGTYAYIKYIKWPGSSTITTDKTAPTISDVYAYDVSAQGYTVHCIVRDDKALGYVQFPTWTSNTDASGNNQDDIIWGSAGAVAGTGWELNYRVNVSDHNYEADCFYYTHIYCYDAAGNVSVDGSITVFVDKTPPEISNVEVVNDELGYTITCTVKDNYKVSKVLFPTWTSYNGQDDLSSDWQTSEFMKGKYDEATGTVTYRVDKSNHNAENGQYITDIYAYDESGNCSSYRTGNMFRYYILYADEMNNDGQEAGKGEIFGYGGANQYTMPRSYVKGDTTVLPDGIKQGFRFLGWYTGGGEKVTSVEGREGNLSLCARWESDIYGKESKINNVLLKYGLSEMAWDNNTGKGIKLESTDTKVEPIENYYYGQNSFQVYIDVNPGWYKLREMGDYNGTESFDEFYMEIWPEGDESKIKGFRFEATPENMNKRYISFSDDNSWIGLETRKYNYRIYVVRQNVKNNDPNVDWKTNWSGWNEYAYVNKNIASLPYEGSFMVHRYHLTEKVCGEKIRYAYFECDACSDKILLTTEKGLGHNYIGSKNLKEATCVSDGIRQQTCIRCGKTREKIIPALKHSKTELRNQKESTAESDGYTGDVYCVYCGQKLTTGKVVPKLNNKKENKQENKQAQTAEIGKVVKDTSTNTVAKVLKDGRTAEVIKAASGKNKSVKIPDTIDVNGVECKIVSISDNAFKNNKKLVSIVIGSNVKTIGSNAFYNCKKLKNISGMASVTSIGAQAFKNCTSLSKITIPKNVTSIGKMAFANCSKLKKITIKTSLLSGKNVGRKAFYKTNAKATVKVPGRKLKAYKKLLKSKGMGKKAKYKK